MLLKRIGFYLGGLSIGLVFVAFIFNEKKTSCNYGPEARVVKNISSKKINYTKTTKQFINTQNIDTILFRKALKRGDVDFKKSDPRKKPCGFYYVELFISEQKLAIIVENCEKFVNIERINLVE